MRLLLALLTFCVTTLFHSDVFANELLVGRVVGISDGDTITVLDTSKVQHKIRLSGIDAPEKAQPFGQRAKQHLSDTVFGKSVQVFGNKTDRYKRTVAKVMVNGVDANLEQIKAGFAWHYKKYQVEQSHEDRAAYAEAEVQARAKGVGLWREPNPIPPWDWRDGKKTHNVSEVDSTQSSECLCAVGTFCTGARGGQYCVNTNGNKVYKKR